MVSNWLARLPCTSRFGELIPTSTLCVLSFHILHGFSMDALVFLPYSKDMKCMLNGILSTLCEGVCVFVCVCVSEGMAPLVFPALYPKSPRIDSRPLVNLCKDKRYRSGWMDKSQLLHIQYTTVHFLSKLLKWIVRVLILKVYCMFCTTQLLG